MYFIKENYGKNGKIIGNGSFKIGNYKENSKYIKSGSSRITFLFLLIYTA